ncbi:MAG: ATP-binding protein [Clostridia bacterium]|nr:ATP-binding protein [Clostridia bacterium]
MSKIILICGKICSGKTYYANIIKEKEKAVILSTDEATFDLINNEQGEFYNIFANRVNKYLRKKAVEICKNGCSVILDWGFWTREGRKEITEFLIQNNVKFEWHYIDVSEKKWKQQIVYRNKKIQDGNGGQDFYLDDGLMKKLLLNFQEPDPQEIDVWYKNY